MRVIEHKNWKSYWAKNYKICYLANFVYSLPKYDRAFFDDLDVSETVQANINEIKRYLLYFDYVYLPLGSLIKPRNAFVKEVGKSLFRNLDFLELIERGLIVASIYRDHGVIETFKRRSDHVKKINWDNRTNIFETLIKYELSNFIFFERDVQLEIENNLEGILKRIERVQDSTTRNMLTDVLRESTTKSRFGLSRPYFYQQAFKRGNTNVSSFLNMLNVQNFETTEVGVPGLVVPYQAGSDRLIRLSQNTGVNSFLYNIDFFELFLSLFLERDHLQHLSEMTTESLIRLRANSFWRDYIEFYHNLLKDISKSLVVQTSDGIRERSQVELGKLLSKGKTTLAIELSITVLTLFLSGAKSVMKLKRVDNQINTLKKNSELRSQSNATYQFIRWIKEEIKAFA